MRVVERGGSRGILYHWESSFKGYTEGLHGCIGKCNGFLGVPGLDCVGMIFEKAHIR